MQMTMRPRKVRVTRYKKVIRRDSSTKLSMSNRSHEKKNNHMKSIHVSRHEPQPPLGKLSPVPRKSHVLSTDDEQSAPGTLPVIPVLFDRVSVWSCGGNEVGNGACKLFESRWSSVSA